MRKQPRTLFAAFEHAGVVWVGLVEQEPEELVAQLGYLPEFLDAKDERPAKEQFEDRYRHGGWQPIDGFRMEHRMTTLLFPGDPPLNPFASALLHDNELVLVYPHSLVAILQPNKQFEVARLD